MPEDDGDKGGLADLFLRLAAKGLVAVPIEPTAAMLEAVDEDGDRLWEAGGEHYFRSDEEAFWYARLVWRVMIRASRVS